MPEIMVPHELAVSLLASVEMPQTLGAVVRAFVPRYASSARIDVEDTPHVLAASGAEPVGLPLGLAGEHRGIVHLSGLTPAATPAALERTAALCAQAIENARRFERERHVATAFEHSALVSELPAVSAYRFDALYRAGRDEALVGGDWYDAFVLPDDRIVVSIGDVAGSGLEAAITMVNVRQTLRGVAQVHPDPVTMLEAADRTLRSQHPGFFVTAFVGLLDPVTHQFSFANAGHPAPYVRFADGSLEQLGGRGLPLNVAPDERFRVHHTTLRPGSTLVLYTDGLIESTRDILEGERRLEAVIGDRSRATEALTAQGVHERVLSAPSLDDVAILVIETNPSRSHTRWRFDPVWPDAARRVRHELLEKLESSGNASEHTFAVECVFAELMGNAIRYAPGTVELILERRDAGFALHLLDKGPGFQINPRLPSDLYSEFGRGLFLIAEFAAEFRVERRPGGGSHLRVSFVPSAGECNP